ncbi:MAG: FAD-binding oxidoreductase [Bacteroidota bacterium]|nr:FAD-binding oxidoreductase [Bacteroidota bacterium]
MQTEFLIIGQGISGTFLSYYLQKAGRSFVVIDNNDNNSASRIAAGIINPVTGRRMVTVWMADEILPFAWKAYHEIGHDLGITAISHRNIIDFFPNPFMRENFLKRTEEGNEYTRAFPDQEHFRSWFNFEFSCGEINPVYTAHLETLLPAWRQQLTNQQSLWEENFEIAQLRFEAGAIHYKNIKAGNIIFCDGPAGIDNPYFKQLPYALNKGEALMMEIPGLPATHIFKKSLVLAPLQNAGKDIFWVGSNYAWEFDNANPTKEFRETTERVLKEWLKIPFQIIDHRAGLRPATLERRPFVGLHPHYKQAGLLNGMGTKGCSLAPFFAKQLTELLLHGKAITAEADINRFQKILSR